MNPDPADFFARQYDSLRSGNAFVELTDWSSVTLTGKDRQAFLHNFCTNDVKRLTPGECCEAFFTNVKGKIVGHGLVTCRETELVVAGVPGQGLKLVEHLDRYLIREDVQLRDTTHERAYLLMCGSWPDSVAPHLVYSAAVGVYVSPWFKLTNPSAALIETRASSVDALRGTLTRNGVIKCDQNAFESFRIESGIAQFGVDFDEENLPQEVGRDQEAISFTKGCYLGQETVARIDALGHVNQQLVGVRFLGEEVPEVGTELSLGDKTVGRVTSAAFSPRLNAPLALAMLRREANTPGKRLGSPLGECEVVQLPVEAA